VEDGDLESIDEKDSSHNKNMPLGMLRILDGKKLEFETD
jgi:hypothetical protein